MTHTPEKPQKTGQQLRTEMIAFARDSIAASGIPDGWTAGIPVRPSPWNPNTWEFSGDVCSTTGDNAERLRFELALFHEPVGDTVAFAIRMGEYWQDQGYVVSTVVKTLTNPGGEHLTELRADRPEDGSLAAGVTAQDSPVFALDFYSECSTDPTLEDIVGPDGYRTWDPVGTPEERRAPNQTTTPTPLPFDDDDDADTE